MINKRFPPDPLKRRRRISTCAARIAGSQAPGMRRRRAYNMTMTGIPIQAKRLRELDKLMGELGIAFGRMALLEEALTHSSYAAENPGSIDNERLEFFGDSVLKFVISEYLLERFPAYGEGSLTEIRNVLVSDKTLAGVAERLKLGRYILTGRRVSTTPSIAAGALEALIAAAYMDLGLIPVQHLIIRLFGAQATAVDRDETKENYKARLQEWAQSLAKPLPVYSLTGVEGPVHDRPVFSVSVSVGQTVMGAGTGHTKKEAEQAAARDALTRINTAEP